MDADRFYSFLTAFRIFLIGLSCYTLYLLLVRNYQNQGDWNVKTKDYWFAMLMWCLAGIAFVIQAMIFHRPFTPGTVFVTAAILVSGKALNNPGTWGGDDRGKSRRVKRRRR